jgi:peptidoglycan/xylan/chitin deacetylase (PgdA/CDA1 family)
MVSALRRAGFWLAESRAFASCVSHAERWRAARGGNLHVLTYHRVDWPENTPHLNPRLISATPENFLRQVDFLAEQRHGVSVQEVLAAVENGTQLPPRSVLITFDDAYRDFAENAWPALRERKLPVTLFVPTAYPDQPQRAFWWDRVWQALAAANCPRVELEGLGVLSLADGGARLSAARRIAQRVKSLPHAQAMELVETICRRLHAPPPVNAVLAWDELRRLAAEGVTLAPHTRTHPLLNRLPESEVHQEVVGAREDLEREVGPVPPVFAYPAGGYNDAVVRIVQEAGFRLAFTTLRGSVRFPLGDPLRARRINVGRNTPHALLRAQLIF